MTRNFVLYAAIPAAVGLMLIGMYFSGVHALQNIVSPNIDLPDPDAPGEFGLLQNLQNVCLITIIAIAGLAAKRAHGRVRFLFAAVAALTVLALLEEIDYGFQYYEILTSASSYDSSRTHNIHSIGDADKLLTRLADIVLLICFGVLPLALNRSTNPAVRAFLPSPYCLLTLLVMLATPLLAHQLHDLGVGNPGSIVKYLSEVHELNIYYLGMLYLYDIAHRPFATALKPTRQSLPTNQNGTNEINKF